MKIRTKLLLLLTLGVLVPLVLSHVIPTRTALESMNGIIREDLFAGASGLAGRIDDRVRWMVDGVGLVVESVPFERFEGDERHAALAIPYRQLVDATVVALLDESGRAVAPPYRPEPDDAALLGRRPVTDDDLALFARSVPLDLALKANVAIGPVHQSGAADPRMIVAAAFPLADARTRWVLAVEFTLAPLCDLLSNGTGTKDSRAVLVDQRGYSICAPFAGAPGEWRPMEATALARLREAAAGAVSEADGPDGEVMRAVDEIPLTGWRLAVDVPRSIAMTPVVRSLRATAIWIGVAILVALIGGAVLARGMTRPIAQLEAASRRVARGEFDARLEVASRDEIGALAVAFNAMTEEIRAWNAELTARVEERTRELKQAQEQILLSQRMAAVGELGAGVAHEINNPLTGVMGLAQLLRAEAKSGGETAETLDEIIANARRVAKIVDELLRYSQSQVASEMQPVDLGEVLRKSAWFFENRFSESKIEVVWETEAGCIVNAVEADLRAAFNNLLDNALKAMPEGGRIHLAVSRVEGGATKAVVRDEGVGMAEEIRARAFDPFFTTAAPGSPSAGLGLAAVHRVVEQHGGRIVLESVRGAGTTATIYLPGRVRLSKS